MYGGVNCHVKNADSDLKPINLNFVSRCFAGSEEDEDEGSVKAAAVMSEKKGQGQGLRSTEVTCQEKGWEGAREMMQEELLEKDSARMMLTFSLKNSVSGNAACVFRRGNLGRRTESEGKDLGSE